MNPSALRKAALVFAGVVMGLLGLAIGFWFYLQAARIDEARSAIGDRLEIASEAIADVEVAKEEEAIRTVLSDVVLYDEQSKPIVEAPEVALTLDLASLDDDGPLEFYDVEIREPTARLVQTPDGDWNMAGVVGISAGGDPVEIGEGRSFVLRDISIEDGRFEIAIPTDVGLPSEGRFALDVPHLMIGGEPFQFFEFVEVQATLPVVTFGGEEGWSAVVESLTAELVQPNLRIDQFAGVFEENEDGVDFDLAALRFGNSFVSGTGTARSTDDALTWDAEFDADLDLADLQPFFPNLQAEGTASFALDLETVAPDRLRLAFSEADVTAAGSTVRGSIALAVGGDQPIALLDADLELDPLQLGTFAELGIVDEELPLFGDITGSVTTAGAAAGSADVDLSMSLIPVESPAMEPSILFATGDIAIGDPNEPIRLDGLAVSAQPLFLATLRPFLPDQEDRLRGEVSGIATLAGTLDEIQISGGDLSYAVGDAPTSSFSGLEGRLVLGDEMSYEFSAISDPLALATLSELFPALPVRSATLSGPIEIAGDGESAEMSADLTGAAGGLQFTGSLGFDDPLRFDFDGSLRAFAAGMILRPEVPIEGPLTGDFSIEGTTEEFAFDVDFAQTDGQFALAGTVDFGPGDPVFQVAGEVTNFRVGSLLGAPELFPDPLTGEIDLRGGGAQPYVFDIDLQGSVGRLDLAGFYEPGAIPRYEAVGAVAGLDLSQLPFDLGLPPTNLTGSVDVAGMGTDVNTISGEYAFDFTASTVADITVNAALAEVSIQSGVAVVDTLQLQLEDTQLSAEGRWGLTSPATEPLRYSFVSQDLSALNRLFARGELIPPDIEGSVSAEGEVGGSFEFPEIRTALVGQDLRYEDWRAGSLTLDADVARDRIMGWSGELATESDNLELPRIDSFETVRLEASGDESQVAVGLFARRDFESDIAFSGLLELEGAIPRGISLQTMGLRVDGVMWSLVDPARVQYAEDTGVTVEDLELQRAGEESGRIAINGTLPPQGIANFSIATTNFDLADLHRINESAPAISGEVTLDLLIAGPVENPEVSIQGEAVNLTYEGVDADLVTLDAVYSGNRLTGTATGTMQGQEMFDADMAIPMSVSLQDLQVSAELLSTAPLEVVVAADSMPLGFLTAPMPGLTALSGFASAQVQIGGTIESPTLDGTATLQNGAIESESAGVTYTGIEGNLTLSGNRVTIDRLAASSGGTLVANGTVDFIPGGDPQLSLNATFDEFEAINNPEATELNVSGQLAFAGALSTPVVTGRVELNESTFQVPELRAAQPGFDLAYADVDQFSATPNGDLTLVPPILGNIRVDGVEVNIDESVWLESPDLRVQFTGDLVLYRTSEDLRVFGSLEAVRGTYTLELSGITREFDVVSGRVQFFGTGDMNPSLDIVAGYEVRGPTVGSGGDLTVLVEVSGTLRSPRVQLAADTPVPVSEADLISYLLFGQPSFELGGVNQAFAEQVLVQEFVGGFLATEIERPLLRAGICDWVRVRPGVTSSFASLVGGSPLAGTLIECGTELAPDLFLTARTSIGGLFGGDFSDWLLGVEWQIDDQWMWEASYGSVLRDPAFGIFGDTPARQFSTDLRRRWEYGLPSREPEVDLTPEEALPGIDGPPLPPAPSPADTLNLQD
ncbi:MAG: hypothetical protein GEU90_03645 [Gemmatimonas sp.]|nr:hypothetical protein [Gemmatimonas sp.]